MRRSLAFCTLILGIVLFAPATGYAQQSINFSLGGFVPRSEDSRVNGDVLVENLDFLAFNIKDFKTGAYGGEWEFPLNEFLHAGLGVGLTTRSVPSVYTDFVEDDQSEIEQTLKLRIVPLTATLRFLPLGSSAPVQPYIGAGIGIFAWRYSESGEFIDFANGGDVFRETYSDSGATAGPVIFGGIAFPIGQWAIGGEVKYQSAQGELDPGQNFAGDKIDLGGMTYSAVFKVRF
jgi:hypothetical protein